MESNKRINVLQLVEGFGWGGAEKKLLELVKCMDRSKFNTVICSLGLVEHIRDEFENIGVKVYTIGRKKRIDVSLIPRVARLMKDQQIDVVMSTLFYADVLGPLAGRLARVKAIFSWETISAPEWLYKRRLYPYLFAIRFCDRVIAVSQATAQFLKEKRKVAPEKIMVIPYGVDLQKYRNGDNSDIRQRLQLGQDELVVGVVGRLHPQKGHRYLIQAAEKIVTEIPNVKFVFAGDGDLRGELEAQIRSQGLENNFRILGYRDDIPEVMRAFDIFTLPSLYEGLPNVVLEAMACGKPVIATAVDGTVEAVVDGKTGLLVQPADVDALRRSLITLLRDRELAQRMGKNGRLRVETQFSLEKQVQRFEQLYESFVGQRN